MADIKQEYREWLKKNGVSADASVGSYCSTLNTFGLWDANLHEVREKLFPLLNKENKTHQESDQMSHLKKFISFLVEKQKKEQEMAGAKAVHETAKTSSDIDWEPAVEGKPQFGSFTDIRDGQKYKCFKIGDQIWMAESLKYRGGWAGIAETYNSWDTPSNSIGKEGDVQYMWAASMNIPSCLNKIALSKDDKLLTEGGAIWEGGTMISDQPSYQGLAPEGWHIPSIAEFDELSNTVLELPGALDDDEFLFKLFGEKTSGCPWCTWFWTVNEFCADAAYSAAIDTAGSGVKAEVHEKIDYCYVRCIKNAD